MSNNRSDASLQDIINIQVLYDINQIMKQDAWNSDFWSILLYGSLEHLLSDANNIRKSLIWIVKYISKKKIKNNKTNEVDNLKDIGEANQWSKHQQEWE